jgi:hydrogenase maturation protein HypF
MTKQRLHLTIQGAVQGVGFRPFIYRLAAELGLVGWVNNSSQGVLIEVEGKREILEKFLTLIETEKPPRSQIQSLDFVWLELVGYTEFTIRTSSKGEKTAVVLPDISTCPDCLQEIFAPQNRRYRYPFTNCTNCGPRYTIIEALPYDRCNTTMKGFQMCPECQSEYENPLNRRFHAQANACNICGPYLELWDRQGTVLASRDGALLATAKAIRERKIMAVKGLGGFHLMVDARNSSAVKELRKRKGRREKPFALMYPSLDLVKLHCQVTPIEEELLLSPESPIVLLKRKGEEFNLSQSSSLSPCQDVAPGNPYLGVMLPSTPLHHLLLAELRFPVVATSGNISDEPICIDEGEALERLGAIADLFLIHNRPIICPVDDSIVRLMGGRAMVLRRARGYAPLPITLSLDKSKIPSPLTSKILAVGGHLKNTIAIAKQNQVFLSQHLGDLETSAAFTSFQNVIKNLGNLYEFVPDIIACDAHPDYLSSQFAWQQNLPVIQVQHHYAHVLSCQVENELEMPLLGIAWDGTGYGLDGTIWGGEFLYVTDDNYQRIAHLRTFKLPGGQQSVKEPCRVALGLLYELFGNLDIVSQTPLKNVFSAQELKIINRLLSRNINAPTTSSMGRLFDGVAALLGVCQQASFEGQAAMELEFAIESITTNKSYQFEILQSCQSSATVVDWSLMLQEILYDVSSNISLAEIAAKFHNTLVEIIINIARQVGEKQVLLTGGCFQNKYLTERAIQRLQEEQFQPYWHQYIPPNDGGIALGQIVAAISHCRGARLAPISH